MSSTDSRPLAAGVTLGIIAAICIAGIFIATRRFRRRRASAIEGDELPSHRSRVMDVNHPASRISPFGGISGSREVPEYAFAHAPGTNMRLATREEDGGWTFSQTFPQSPVPPTPAYASTPRKLTKEQEASWHKYERRKDHDDDGFETGYGAIVEPPPAYGAGATH